jgi:hypothetical protein
LAFKSKKALKIEQKFFKIYLTKITGGQRRRQLPGLQPVQGPVETAHRPVVLAGRRLGAETAELFRHQAASNWENFL